MDPITITTLTPSGIQQDLQNDGLDTLGLTTLALATRWADATPAGSDYDHSNLTLNLSTLRAPFRGIRDFAFSPAASTLSAGIGGTDTTLTVKAGEGAKFPSPTGEGVLLMLKTAGGSKTEVVQCTARSGDTFTIVRAAMGTAKQAFSTGAQVALRLGSSTRSDSFCGADGRPLSGSVAVFRLHPQGVLRLQALMAARYAGAGAPAILPAPAAMVVRGAAGFSTARWFEPDETIAGLSGPISFHDGRGWIVDPIFVAAVFADLAAWLPGLIGRNQGGTLGGAGGVQSIAGLASGTLVHFVDLHGTVFQPVSAGAGIITKDGGTGAAVPASGLVTLNSGEGIEANAGDTQSRLRWGWATNGVLSRTRLLPPALPATGTPAPTLGRQFYRVFVVDVPWTLLGNRTTASVRGIAADDQSIPSDVQPVPRDQVVINYLVDGPEVLAQSATVLTRPSQGMVLVVSPAIDRTMSIPTQPGLTAHWPAFPGPNTGAGFSNPSGSPATGITAAFSGANDVVVTIASDTVPPGSHIRIFPRQFVVIPAIAEEPSFVRGDGGAALAVGGTASQVFLPNPFGLVSGQPLPAPANLTMDIVVTPRTGRRKIWGAVSVAVVAGPVAAPADPFGGGNVVAALPPTFESVAPVPLFGVPTTQGPPGSAPTGVVAFVRALASETSPRQGPRLPTMARAETIIVTGTTAGTPTPAGTLMWEAVLSGGRWTRDTRSAGHASANPGNPAGPDVLSAGVHVSGALAYDLAVHAMKRAQPILPLPGATTPGWVIAMDGNNFNVPQDNVTANTGTGVLLETVAAVCETPELSALTPPAPGSTIQQALNSIAGSLGVTPPTFVTTNEPRLEREVRREVIVSGAGLRDAQWSLRRAVREARELIFIESPQFARTAWSATALTPSQVDLIADIVTSLQSQPNLKVIVCTSREADFATKYKGWSRQHFKARNQAVGNLLAVAPDRVATFHPVGFPGRTAFVRTTTVIVDDVWCLIGATHWRRRGMTFDGSAAIASFDRQIENGYSRNVRAFRRALMANRLGIPTPVGSASADWLRLGHPQSAFELISDWLSEGGLGRIQRLWPGPADTTVLPASNDIADPDGTDGSNFVTVFANLIAELGD